MRAVHATARSRARIVLVEAQAAKSGGLEVMPPLVEREDRGLGSRETPELSELLQRASS
jgi:tRNA1(Val) A37 N6-methylase TrmN6